MKKYILILISFLSLPTLSQEKNFLNNPYIEIQGKADTLITPNRIYINVIISEKDNRNKKSVEDMEAEMMIKLKQIGVNTEKDVEIKDFTSMFKKYLLKQTDIQKIKSYYILAYDGSTASKIFTGLEEIGLSNTRIEKLEHSDYEKLKLTLNSKASQNAKESALSFVKPFNQTIGRAFFIGNVEISLNSLAGTGSGIIIRGMASNPSIYGSRSPDLSPEIEFQKIKIESKVNVRFALE